MCWSEGERADLFPALVAEPAEGGLVGPLGLGGGFVRGRDVVSLFEPFEGGLIVEGESVGGVFRGERMPRRAPLESFAYGFVVISGGSW